MDPTLKQKMDKFFNPKSVAIIGASSRPGQFSNNCVRKLSKWSNKDHVYPINPRLSELHGLKCYPSISAVPEKVDLAYICVGAQAVPAVMKECVEAGVESCLIFTSGFAEVGDEGRELQDEVVKIAQEGGIRLIGPNCFGVYNHATGLFVDKVDPGSAAVVSHSGSITMTITHLGLERGIKYSKTVSCGNQADITAADLIEYLGEDPETSLIFVYMEGVGDGERLLSVLRKVTRTKPVLIWKGGRTSAGSRAASSHSAALAGNFEVFKSAIHQAGAILCDDIEELIDVGLAFQHMPLPKGKNVTVITGPGGPGVTSADACDEMGLECPAIQESSTVKLQEFIPEFGSLANPVDLTTASLVNPSLYAKTMDVLVGDDDQDMFLIVGGGGSEAFAEAIVGSKDNWSEKPFAVNIISSSAGFSKMAAIFGEAGVALYPTPRRAVNALAHLANYAEYVRTRSSVPAVPEKIDRAQAQKEAQAVISAAKEAGQVMLTERQAMDLFAGYGIPVVGRGLAHTYEEALSVVKEIGYPVVLKVSSPDVVHKTDAGGVYLNVSNDDELKKAFDQVTTEPLKSVPGAKIEGALIQNMVKAQFELSAGMLRDEQFGPVVMFGLGGIFIEVLHDVAMRTTPISKVDALEMIGEVRAHSILDGPRGLKPVDKAEVVSIIMALAAMATDLKEIAEVDINPLAATEKGLIAVDARIKVV